MSLMKHPRFSKLVSAMLEKPSAIKSMMKLADERNIRRIGLDPSQVISLGGGWVGHHPPERLREIYAEIALDREKFYRVSGYPPIPGVPECRKSLAEMDRYLFGADIMEENVIIGATSTEITYDLLRALLDPDDRMLLLDPTYTNYPGQTMLALNDPSIDLSYDNSSITESNSKIIHLKVFDSSSWRYMPDVDRSICELEELFKKHKPKAMMIATPDNPTGQIIPQKFVEAAMELCTENDSYLIIDFTYKWQNFSTKSPEYFSWSPREYGNLILVYSASKWSRALGRRLGWICASQEIVEAMETLLAYSILCGDHMHQLATAIYLEESMNDGSLRKYLDFWNERYKEAANITVNSIDKYCGCRRLVPMGALYTVMDLGMTAELMVEKILKNTGVLLIPGIMFGSSLINGVRISYGPLVEKPSLIEEGLHRVGEYINTLRKR